MSWVTKGRWWPLRTWCSANLIILKHPSEHGHKWRRLNCGQWCFSNNVKWLTGRADVSAESSPRYTQILFLHPEALRMSQEGRVEERLQLPAPWLKCLWHLRRPTIYWAVCRSFPQTESNSGSPSDRPAHLTWKVVPFYPVELVLLP